MIDNDRNKYVFIILMCARASAGWPVASLWHLSRTLKINLRACHSYQKHHDHYPSETSSVHKKTTAYIAHCSQYVNMLAVSRTYC